MDIGAKSAVIDNDFLSHVAEIKSPTSEITALFQKVLTELGVEGIMHPLVYQHEVMRDNPAVMAFFDKNVIGRPSFEDMFSENSAKEQYYCYLIPELYHALKGKAFPEENIFRYWKRQESLGEIHSMAMCLVCGCGLFLSDDGDSKQLMRIIKDRTLEEIPVYNREDAIRKCEELFGNRFSREERRKFTHKSP